MQVHRHKYLKEQLICDLTKELTEALNYKSEYIRVYVVDMIWEHSTPDNIEYPIRITGRTIGVMRLDNNRNIKEIVIGEDCYNLFKVDCNEIINKFIGEKFEETTEWLSAKISIASLTMRIINAL